MKLCLDTDIAIELIRGVRPHYRARLQDAQRVGASLHLPSVAFRSSIGAIPAGRSTAQPCSACTGRNSGLIAALDH